MPVVEVPINPTALAWALRRARMGPQGLAKAAGARLEKAQAWLEGRARPTYKQAKKIARKLGVSLGQLLIEPPERVDLPIPDLRRGATVRDEPSLDLMETVYDALRKRDWWREYRGGKRLPFVGSLDWEKATPEQVAQAIQEYIPVQELWDEARGWDDFLRKLTGMAERAGILVLRTGIVGNNTHRPLDPNEFAGFAIADPVAPIVLINTRDYIARRNFTFAHELAHIWLGESALDDNPELEARDRLESLCDQVAAEFLVPKAALVREWVGQPTEAATKAARRFWVSTWVIARRARDLGLIDQGEYRQVLETYYRDLPQRESKDSGGTIYTALPARNSPTFTDAVVAAALQGEITFKEAASLLNLSLRAFLTYLERRSDAVSS